MGGGCTRTYYFGKPHEEHFHACLRELQLDPDRVAHVGDSLHHDIAGANAAGIPSIFITGGIHSDYFDGIFDGTGGTDENESSKNKLDNTSLETLFEEYGGHVPTHVMPLFQF